MGSFETRVTCVQRTQPVTDIDTDVLIIPVLQAANDNQADDADNADKKANYQVYGCLTALDDAMGGSVKEALDAECFSASLGAFRVFKVRPNEAVKAQWVILLGVSLPEKSSVKMPRFDRVMSAYQKAFTSVFKFGAVHRFAVCLGEASFAQAFSLEHWVYAIVQGAYKATYKMAEADAKKIHEFKELTLLTPEPVSDTALEYALAAAKAEAQAKDLANQPANLKSVSALVDVAKSVESLPGVTLSVISDLKTIQETMPAFWAVGQATAVTDDPLQFITLRYRHPNASANCPKLALVGKGVIFDTGGVQVKPDNYMNDMKFDMTGAATVLSVVSEIARLGVENIDVTAYVAATRNLTGETAYLPDSVIGSSAGKKIEVRHTDAEGRLTLADAVHKAVEDKPDEMITIATLTGAAAAAVGQCTALMGTCEQHKAFVETAFKQVGELVQSLEFIEEDYENVKSDLHCADLRNTSKGKGRGHLTAGAFVASFAGDIPLVHLDIAGGDAKDGFASGIAAKGLLQYVLNKVTA
jgi:leucyl aminopeptidase